LFSEGLSVGFRRNCPTILSYLRLWLDGPRDVALAPKSAYKLGSSIYMCHVVALTSYLTDAPPC